MTSKPHPAVKKGLVAGPFHDRLAALNVQQAWMNWMGFASPAVLENVEYEYFAIRNQATLFDISPMCKYDIEGPDAEAVVNRLVTRDVRKLAPGRVAYCLWCDEDGNVIDDGTVFRFGARKFRLCCQEPQLAWLQDVAFGFETKIRDVSAEVAGLALQGPTSAAILRAFGFGGVERLKPFAIAHRQIRGGELAISRTGFTGDLGYELWMAPRHAAKIWDMLIAAGANFGLRAIGYRALEMARIEAGFLLPKADFLSSRGVLRADRARNPYELGLERLVQFDKPHFNGKRALARLAMQAPARKLLAIEIERDKPAVNALVYHRKKREIGMVTSALWSPTVKRNIAYAWLDAPYGQRVLDDLWVEIYLQRELVWQRRMARCRVVEKPFFSHPRRAATPPAGY